VIINRFALTLLFLLTAINVSASVPKSDQQQMLRFDIPITYNAKVSQWVKYFQTKGKKWFQVWLDRSEQYIPHIHRLLDQQGLPRDLSYLAMIESGYSSGAVSTASAVGYWQFILPTAQRYGLQHSWWIDERKDIIKSTWAASRYLSDLKKIFGSWYLAASAYNMGETRLKKLIQKHKTKDFWILSQRTDFPKETREYIPKLIAATMIAKAPKLYGFRVSNGKPLEYNYFYVPGGTDLFRLAEHLGVTRKDLMQLNPELIHGIVPKHVVSHRIRIPQGSAKKVASYIRTTNPKL
jgi:membrane-bound lytic murein transglycosylase D